MQKEISKRICLASVMAALYMVLDILSFDTGSSLKISISCLPIMIVAAFYGPLWGAATGFVGAFLGQLLTYGFGVTTFLWVLPAAIRGLVFGALFWKFKKPIERPQLFANMFLSSLAVTASNSIVMYIDSLIYCYPIKILGPMLAYRFAINMITTCLFIFPFETILKAVKKVFKL